MSIHVFRLLAVASWQIPIGVLAMRIASTLIKVLTYYMIHMKGSARVLFLSSLDSELESELHRWGVSIDKIDIYDISYLNHDIAFLDLNYGYRRERILDLFRYVKERGLNTLLAIHGVLTNLHRDPYLLRELSNQGFSRAILPIDEGVLLLTLRGYDESFFRIAIETWRKSMVKGPQPVQLNTALLLYVITKSLLTESSRRLVVEVGTGRGFSTLWLAKAVKEVGGKLVTFEVDEGKARDAETFLKKVDLLDAVEIVIDDFCRAVDAIQDKISILFIDGRKEEYHRYLQMAKRKLAKGSLVIAHNTVSHPHLVSEYLVEVYSSEFMSLTTMSDPAGVTISVYLGES